MTRLTAILLQDPQAEASWWGPVDGKFGVYIGTMDESPSGHQRPRPLLTTAPTYDTQEEAEAAAKSILAEARTVDLEDKHDTS